MTTLGLTSPLSVNTAACVVADGELIAFAEEERFTGIKHAPRQVPAHAMAYCLKEAGVTLDEVDAITLGYDPPFRAWRKNARANLLEGNIGRGVRESGAFVEYALNMVRLRDHLWSLSASPRDVLRKVHFIPHHIAHAASAARCSGFSECAVLTLDGVGEGDAGLLGVFRDNRLTKLRSVPINQSLGWLYALVTDLCGFTPHSHEGKVMALAGYGTPNLQSLQGIAELRPDGYRLPYRWHRRLYERFGPRRRAHEPLTDRHRDLAASTQHFLEQAGQNLVRWLLERTGVRNVALAGGVALNCDLDAKILALDCVDQVFVQPAAHDAGTALGAALEYYANTTGRSCAPLRHAYYGPTATDEDVTSLLAEAKLPVRKLTSLRGVAELLRDGKIVGWCVGKMEFGPRALGARSILAHPGLPGVKDRVNSQVKHRESWRPFAPSVLASHAPAWFEKYAPSPFMLLTFQVPKAKRAALAAVTHVDGTARVQEVSTETNRPYADLLEEFYRLTGIPLLLNTSLNDAEKPICRGPREALQLFASTGLDALVLNDYLLLKSDFQ